MINSYWNLTIYMMIYSLLGWIVEVIYYSIKDKKFKNRGFLNLPFNISYGILAVILITVLPTLGKNYLLQYVVSFVAIIIVKNITDFFIENINAITNLSIPLLKVTLPIGISFYTFQLLSYKFAN